MCNCCCKLFSLFLLFLFLLLLAFFSPLFSQIYRTRKMRASTHIPICACAFVCARAMLFTFPRVISSLSFALRAHARYLKKILLALTITCTYVLMYLEFPHLLAQHLTNCSAALRPQYISAIGALIPTCNPQ